MNLNVHRVMLSVLAVPVLPSSCRAASPMPAPCAHVALPIAFDISILGVLAENEWERAYGHMTADRHVSKSVHDIIYIHPQNEATLGTLPILLVVEAVLGLFIFIVIFLANRQNARHEVHGSKHE